jgi:hypothetical protein
MRAKAHLKLLVIVTIAWILFWAGGLPDYYQQYSVTFMIVFDVAILSPIWFLVYRSIKNAKPGRGFIISIWWAFYISIPLFVYDLLYVAIYLNYGVSFLWTHWYLTVYYILPWLIFPLNGWFIEKKRKP